MDLFINVSCCRENLQEQIEAFGVNLEIKLYHDTKRIELEYAIKLPAGDGALRVLYVAFPSNCPEGKLAFDVQGGTVISGKNQLEGHLQTEYCSKTLYRYKIIGANYYRKQPHPLYQLGDINLGKFQYQKQYEKASCLTVGDE